MPSSEISSRDLQSIGEVDRLVHEPARMMILALLHVVDSADFLFLLRHTGLTRGNLSSHMSRLEAGGYVDIQKEFVGKTPRTILRMTEQGREAFQTYRQSILQVLGDLPD